MPPPRLASLFRVPRGAKLSAPQIVRGAGAGALFIGASILIAWATDLAWWAGLIPDLQRMNPVTAASLALLGAALLLPRRRWPAAVKAAKWVIGCLVAAAGAAKLAQLAIGVGGGVDLLILPARVLAVRRAMIAPNTAVCLVLLGIALLLTSRPRRAIAVAQVLALTAGFVVIAALVGDAYGAINLYAFHGIAAMSVPTAIGLGLVTVGVLSLAPALGPMSIVTNSSFGGATARRLLPIVTGVALCAGALRTLAVRLKLFDENTAIALMVTGMLISLVVVVLVTARRLRDISAVLKDRERAIRAYADELAVARDAAQAAATVKTDFLANMSHELRTPLTSIIGFTGLAAAQSELSELTRNYVERVRDASQALLCTVNDILDFSKLEAGQASIHPQPVAISKLSRATLDLFTPQAGAKDLQLVLDETLDPKLFLSLDPDRVRQILLNLVGNAVKFTSSGTVTLRTSYDPERATLNVEVIDTGDGIAEDKLARLFQRFSQVDGALAHAVGGTGLGLAICKGLVDAMGGRIGVDSRPGAGSRFWFSIPAPVSAAAPALLDCPDVAHLTFANVRVLVVDDHPANRDLARLILSGLGADVAEADDGETAVELASEWPFDVILMDLRMPRLGGLAALRQIRAAHGPNHSTPILAFTADADPASAERLMAVGFAAVISKPLAPGALIDAVARAAEFSYQAPAERQADVA